MKGGERLILDDDTVTIIDRLPRPTDPDWPLVFTTPQGRPFKPEIITDRWRRRHAWTCPSSACTT